MNSRTVEALVQTGSVETAYIRSGYGLPVLLLKSTPLAELRQDALFAALAAEFRVIAVDCSVTSADWCLGELIDGLGLERPSVVVEAGSHSLLVEIAAAGTDRLDRVVVLRPDQSCDDIIRQLH